MAGRTKRAVARKRSSAWAGKGSLRPYRQPRITTHGSERAQSKRRPVAGEEGYRTA